MVTVNIKLVFPYGDFTPSTFRMELPSVPKAGEGISCLDRTFGPKYDAFVKLVETKFRLCYGCQPQFVNTVFHINGSYLAVVSCNPNYNLLSWNSLKDGKKCVLGTTVRPQKGDWFYDDRNEAVYIENVYYYGDNCFGLEIYEDASQESRSTSQIQYDMANNLDQIASDTRDIARRVEGIYYQNR